MSATASPAFKRVSDLADLTGKTALVRVDFNVPVQGGVVGDITRLEAAIPTVRALIDKGAKVALLSHFDRPKGKVVPEMSLAPIAPVFAQALNAPVAFAGDCIGTLAKTAIAQLPAGGVILLENTRFYAGEEANDEAFTAKLAELGDIYVNDAFSAAHRAHATTEGLARHLPAYAGESMARELKALDLALGHPHRPVIALVGGAKVSSKLDLLRNLVGKVDTLIVGGGMANTFLHARGMAVGRSLCEPDLAPVVAEIEAAAKASGCHILLPIDVVAAKAFAAHAEHRVCAANAVAADEMILDAGPQSVGAIVGVFAACRTLVWNGPLGAFELAPFDRATIAAAKEAATLAKDGRLIAVAGGGDTVAALNHAQAASGFTFVSTAGGAFLEWMEGKSLPGVAALSACVL
jgi:phosphoglycerate kinase